MRRVGTCSASAANATWLGHRPVRNALRVLTVVPSVASRASFVHAFANGSPSTFSRAAINETTKRAYSSHSDKTHRSVTDEHYTMRDILNQGVKLQPRNTCLVFDNQHYTYEKFDQRTTWIAHALKKVFEVQQREHIAVLSPNDPRYVEMYYANAKLGTVTCPAVHLFSRTELVNVINNTRARLLVVHETMIPTLMDIKASLPHLQHLIALSKDGSRTSSFPSGFHNYDALIDEFAHEKSMSSIKENICETDIATMFITSGTTGFPKAAAYSHRAVVALVARNLFRFTPQSTICLTNLCAWIGSVDLIASAFGAGSKVVLLGNNDFEGFIQAILQHGATHALFMPGVMHGFAQLDPQIQRRVAEQLKVMVYVGGTIPVKVLQEVIRALPNTAILQTYGLTECVGVTALTEHDHPINPTAVQLKRLESCGRLLFGAKLKIMRKDGSECAPEEEGEIVVQAPNMMSGYFNQPQETAAVLKHGWFHTGDVGYLDRDGYLFLLSRIKDVINPPSGIKVYPRELEDVLHWHKGVKEVAVVGDMKPDLSGQDIVAFVVPNTETPEGRELTETDVLQWCQRHLALYKCPQRVVMVAEIPKNQNNKPLKHVLQRRLQEERNQ